MNIKENIGKHMKTHEEKLNKYTKNNRLLFVIVDVCCFVLFVVVWIVVYMCLICLYMFLYGC